MTKVKICGITNLQDAKVSLDLGADMLGFNFYEKSPRYISPQDAKPLINDLPGETITIGVFVNTDCRNIGEHADLLGLRAVQLHGDESNEFLSSLRRYTDAKIIKAIRVGPNFDLGSIKESAADAVLLDAFSVGQFGGTGKQFEWSIAAEGVKLTSELILAGGLLPENVADAVCAVRPYAVDVASGVESSPGKKDPEKLRNFIKNAKRA